MLDYSYFPKNSTKEILDELYPKLFPLDTDKICGAFDMLSIFLNPNHGHELWLKEFMDLWDTYHNPSWNVVSKITNNFTSFNVNVTLFFIKTFNRLPTFRT